jgi:uncharacterized protein YuzE
MIETRHDPDADVLHVRFGPTDARYDSAREVGPGVYVAFDTRGRPMAVEITGVRWISEGSPGARDEVPAAE